MSTFSVLPGTLNVNVRQGDVLSFVVDFDIAVTNYTFEAEIYSTVDGSTVQAMAANVVVAAQGTVQLGLTSEQTAALPVGTYKWFMRWDTGSGSYRTAVEGFFEVRP